MRRVRSMAMLVLAPLFFGLGCHGEVILAGGGGATGTASTGAACVARTCAEVGAECGAIDDGCGNSLMCGDCNAPAACGGAGKPNKCGVKCVPKTCKEQGFECGEASDGCGGTLECGICPLCSTLCCAAGAPLGCEGSKPNKCGCTGILCPPSCKELGYNCGFIKSACAGMPQDCGTCTPPQTCGGGGKPYVCGP